VLQNTRPVVGEARPSHPLAGAALVRRAQGRVDQKREILEPVMEVGIEDGLRNLRGI
jgi:hypothetical protein